MTDVRPTTTILLNIVFVFVFVLDPGVPGVQFVGPDVRPSVSSFLELKKSFLVIIKVDHRKKSDNSEGIDNSERSDIL